MSARWHYRDISLEVQATLTHDGRLYTVPMYGGESLDHAMLKVSIAAHLLVWGYQWEDIRWEQTPHGALSHYRPDLYVRGKGNLPSFWFECLATDQTKLAEIVSTLPDFRVVRVVPYEWFREVWSGGQTAVVDGRLVSLDAIADWRQRKQIVMRRRESVIPPGAECWAVRGRENSPRIIYAVRREPRSILVYLDTGEGWSLSTFRYIPSRREFFRPLIPGVVGNDRWRGKSQAYKENEA